MECYQVQRVRASADSQSIKNLLPIPFAGRSISVASHQTCPVEGGCPCQHEDRAAIARCKSRAQRGQGCRTAAAGDARLWLGGLQRSEAIVIPCGSVVLGEGIGSIAVHGEGVVVCARLCVCLCFCSCVAARASCLRYWWRGANVSIRLVYVDI